MKTDRTQPSVQDRDRDEARSPGMKKKGAQSNHGEYCVPQCVMAWAHEPLYLVIARWCELQGRWINRNDIVAAFLLPERRAAFQLSYISRKKERVVCSTRNSSVPGSRQPRSEIRVECILPPLSAEQKRENRQKRRQQTAKMPGPSSVRVGSGMAGSGGLWDRLLKATREKRDDE